MIIIKHNFQWSSAWKFIRYVNIHCNHGLLKEKNQTNYDWIFQNLGNHKVFMFKITQGKMPWNKGP